MKSFLSLFVILLGFSAFLSSARAQAVYTATGNTRIQAGGGYLYLRTDYADRPTGGLTLWGDYDFNRLIGAEAEAHFGGIVSPEDIGENSYLVGPRFSYRRHKLTIYGKVMVGQGSISNQNLHSSSSYKMYAFGGGLEYKVTRKINIRAIDIEEQKWVHFQPNVLSPVAISIGAMYVIR